MLQGTRLESQTSPGLEIWLRSKAQGLWLSCLFHNFQSIMQFFLNLTFCPPCLWTCKGPRLSGCSAGGPGSLPSYEYPLLRKKAAWPQTTPLFPTLSTHSQSSTFSSTKPVLTRSLSLWFGGGWSFPTDSTACGWCGTELGRGGGQGLWLALRRH